MKLRFILHGAEACRCCGETGFVKPKYLIVIAISMALPRPAGDRRRARQNSGLDKLLWGSGSLDI
jgi:hypothetical protein